MKKKNLFLRLALIVAVWALAIPKAFAFEDYYQYNIHVATNPTGVAKVYVKQSSEADEKYQLNTSGLYDLSGSSSIWDFKYDEDEASPGYFFVGWSLDQPATEESDIVDTSNPSGAITIESTKKLYGAEEATPNPILWDENYKQLVFANFTRLQVESEDDTRGTAAILGSPLVVKDGDQVRIKATAAVNYKFAGWKFNDGTEYASIQNPYPITIGDETAGTYTACFEESSEVVAHDIYIEKPVNGKVQCTSTSAQAGVIPTLIVTPDPGYETVSVKYNEIDATKMAPPKEYSFTMPNDDVYVIVKFAYAKPKGLTVDDATKANATISWEENDQASWKLQYGTDGSFKEGTYQEKDVTGTPSVTLTELDEDQGYYVRVKAYNGTDESEWSDVVSFYPTDIPVIGSGTSTSYSLPTYTSGMYSLTQQIYTAAELGEAGLIESIGFYNTSSATTRNLDIYMVSTDKTQFAGSSDGISVTDDDLVFSGKVTFAENKWTTITLTQPFYYDGTKNVAIIVDDNTNSGQIPSTVFRVYSTGEAYQAISIHNPLFGTTTNYNPKNPPSNFERSTSKNQIRILKSKLEAYAVLTDNETDEYQTLTFYYDASKASWLDEVGDANVFDVPWTGTYPGWTSSFDANSTITTATFDKSFGDYHDLTSTSFMFYDLIELTTINDLKYLNTEKVKDMSSMFSQCESLEELDLSNSFNTEKVTTMASMFSCCYVLKELDLSKFDTKNVTDMSYMFEGCVALEELDLSSFNTEKVTNMEFMFYYCENLETIYCAADADWSGVEGRSYTNMFSNCTKLSGKCGSKEFPWDSDYIEGTYAKVCTASQDGYFTYKGNEDYTLTVGEAGMATLYLDYQANIPEGVKVYYCTGLDDNEAYPKEETTHAIKVENVLPANMGVFVIADEGNYVFTHYTSLDPGSGGSIGGGWGSSGGSWGDWSGIDPGLYGGTYSNILTGSTKKTTVESLSVLTLGYANNVDKTLGFWWYTGTEIPANRAYIPGDKLTSDGGVKGIRILFDDETSISLTPTPSPQGEGSWYSTDGRKMEGKPQQRGLYINNGRKVMVK